MKLLIIDDRMDNAVSLKNLLSRAHDVHIENSLEAGFKAATELCPDIIVCDASLGDSGPMDTVRVAPQGFGGIPVVLWSCYEDADLIDEAFKNGAADFLIKDKTPDPLQRIFFAHLRHLYALSKHEPIGN